MTSTTDHLEHRYITQSPQEMQRRENVGTHAQHNGWTVIDTEWIGPEGSPYIAKGARQEMRAYCRALNRALNRA
jgi:hypothetical protein